MPRALAVALTGLLLIGACTTDSGQTPNPKPRTPAARISVDDFCATGSTRLITAAVATSSQELGLDDLQARIDDLAQAPVADAIADRVEALVAILDDSITLLRGGQIDTTDDLEQFTRKITTTYGALEAGIGQLCDIDLDLSPKDQTEGWTTTGTQYCKNLGVFDHAGEIIAAEQPDRGQLAALSGRVRNAIPPDQISNAHQGVIELIAVLSDGLAVDDPNAAGPQISDRINSYLPAVNALTAWVGLHCLG